jgi:hypothetical protein
MFTYDNMFLEGVQVHLCIHENQHGYILFRNTSTGEVLIRFFTSAGKAKEYIKTYIVN